MGGERFVDGQVRRREVSEEDAAKYREAEKDRERIDRSFHEKYAPLLLSITCTLYKCENQGCVSELFTKGFDFKESTTNKARGLVRNTRCRNTAVFRTFLRQWLSQDTLDTLPRQAKSLQKTTTKKAKDMTEE